MSTEKYNAVTHSKRTILMNNFLGGMAWGIGAAVGGALLLTVVGFAVSKLDYVPVVGSFVADITRYVEQQNPSLEEE